MADESETSAKPRFASHWAEPAHGRAAAHFGERVLGRREIPDMLHHEHLEHRKPARRLPSVAAPSVPPRDAAKFHGLRYADEKPLVVVKFPHLVLKEVEEAGLYCQPVACEMFFCRSSHDNSIAYNYCKLR